jgi:hypothetical protein
LALLNDNQQGEEANKMVIRQMKSANSLLLFAQLLRSASESTLRDIVSKQKLTNASHTRPHPSV